MPVLRLRGLPEVLVPGGQFRRRVLHQVQGAHNHTTLTSLLGKTYMATKFRSIGAECSLNARCCPRFPTARRTSGRGATRGDQTVIDELNARKTKLSEELRTLNNRIRDCHRNLYRITHGIDNVETVVGCSSSAARVPTATVISSAWKCHKCSFYTCNRCMNTKLEGHVCAERRDHGHAAPKGLEAVPRVLDLRHKIDGCDQMFCTGCKTPFSYRTGRFINGQIHNPHYYEYMNTTAGRVRNLNDIPCGGLPSVLELRSFIIRSGEQAREAQTSACHRLIAHIDNVSVPHYTPAQDVNTHRLMRVAYIRGKTTRTECEKRLREIEQRLRRRQEITDVLTMVRDATSDNMRSLVVRQMTLTEFLDDFAKILSYAESALANVSRVHNCVVPRIVYDAHLRLYRVLTMKA